MFVINCSHFVGDLSLKFDDIVNRLVTSVLPDPTVASLDGHKFLLPANCRFLLSDIAHISPLISGMLHFSCFVDHLLIGQLDLVSLTHVVFYIVV